MIKDSLVWDWSWRRFVVGSKEAQSDDSEGKIWTVI